MKKTANLAYVIGVAIGDGNLSNPNGRAVRLRVSCDLKYPGIILRIQREIRVLMPSNKVSLEKPRNNCLNVSCYSNKWESILGWKAKGGPKHVNIIVPKWIKGNSLFSKAFLKGVIETDGCVYLDRGYLMVNFTTVIQSLAESVREMIANLGFRPRVYRSATQYEYNSLPKYVVRVSHRTAEFIKMVNIDKS